MLLALRITSYNVCYTKLLRADRVLDRFDTDHPTGVSRQVESDAADAAVEVEGGRITSYNVCYTKLLR